ncbi:DUF3429 domain-containing protein [Halomonas sp. TRM85114]|uniref:DUF3429 domain-containing protein n=1 Tax=Halomonas jincaotanensis TaxID=2810616 RepID=UPI001BD1F82B|nr:DUF3429 domain-containing protein [Halomonas jincaotanensis]MBS9404894.1 DUF3429 domain-containing protein [Halomonas jincaotanensis]
MSLSSFPRLPVVLGLAGLLPFIVSSAAAWLAPMVWQVIAIKAFVYYSAVILSFLGGVQWGVAMTGDSPEASSYRTRMLLAMVPSLIAWPALLLHPADTAWVLAAGFVLVRLHELSREGRSMLPSWYQGMRTLLTLVVLVCHGVLIWRLSGH